MTLVQLNPNDNFLKERDLPLYYILGISFIVAFVHWSLLLSVNNRVDWLVWTA